MALLVGLGLVIGYPLGYVVGNRDKAPTTAVATAPPAPADGQAGTTGTGTAHATETTVSVPPPVKATDTSTPAVTPRAPVTAPVKTPAPPPPRAKSVTAGRLVVTSNPARAAVTINGKWSGRTPLTLDNLKFGKYEVRVVQPGFEVARERFTLSESAASRTVDVALRRVPADKRAPPPEARSAQSPAAQSKPPVVTTGAIFVDSRPQGARVFIDGKEVGVTPLTVAALPIGSHVVRLELADHQPRTETTQVVGQKTAHVTGSLERIR
jgi:PEGA domain